MVAGESLLWVLFMSFIATLPSICVNPVAVFPPCPPAPLGAQPREIMQLRTEEEFDELLSGGCKDGDAPRSQDKSFIDAGNQQKIWRWPMNGLGDDIREAAQADSRVDGETVQEPIFISDTNLELRDRRIRPCETLSFAVPFTASSESSLFRRMASPGYVHTNTGQSARNVFTGSSVVSTATRSLGESLFLPQRGRMSNRQFVAGNAHSLNLTALNSWPSFQRQPVARPPGMSSVLGDSNVASRLSVPEGAARLRQLSALMRSLREAQIEQTSQLSPSRGGKSCVTPACTTASEEPERVAGRKTVEMILSEFANLRLMPPVSLLPSGPAVTELKGDLVARLGGLSGRYEMSNYSHGFVSRARTSKAECERPALNRGLSPGRAASVASGALLREGDIYGLDDRSQVQFGDRRSHKPHAAVSLFSRKSWHAPRASTRLSPRPPPDEWLDDADMVLRPLVPTLAVVLTRAAAKSACADSGAGKAESGSTSASVFCAQRRPKMAIVDYCDRLAQFSACSGGAFLLAVSF